MSKKWKNTAETVSLQGFAYAILLADIDSNTTPSADPFADRSDLTKNKLVVDAPTDPKWTPASTVTNVWTGAVDSYAVLSDTSGLPTATIDPNPNTAFVEFANHACAGDLTVKSGSPYILNYIKEVWWNSLVATETEVIPMTEFFTVATPATCPITTCNIWAVPVKNIYTPFAEANVALNGIASIDVTKGSAF